MQMRDIYCRQLVVIVVLSFVSLCNLFLTELRIPASSVVQQMAHMIKSSKSLISQAAAALTADRRWCLTGTPIQVSLAA